MNRKTYRSFIVALLLVLTLVMVSCGGTPTPSPTATPEPPTATPEPPTPTPEPTADPESDPLDIIETALAAGNFTTLVSAIQSADLEEKLRSAGPYTLFAPTDEAFAGLREGVLEDPDQLFDILLYHVIEGQFMAADLGEVEALTTLLDDDLTFTPDGGQLLVNDANVTEADIVASNGVIHVIDKVLLPPGVEAALPATGARLDNLVDTMRSNRELSTLIDGLAAAGLLERLSDGGPYTLFAPTDNAFLSLVDAAPSDLVFRLDNDPAPFLLYLVLPGRMYVADIRDGMAMDTLEGSPVEFALNGNGIYVNGANLVTTNLRASNGVIHIIDSVILPPAFDRLSVTARN